MELKTIGLTKKFGSKTAVDDLNITLTNGVYGLLGANGAGKTTLIRLICGLQKPTSGEYVLYGAKNVDPEINKARRRIGAVVETPSIYLDMTAQDNLKMQYQILGMPSYEGIEKLLELVGLENTGRKKAKNFSLGMKQRLGIAIALAGDPDFLILDEPVNGLDPQGIVEMRELILRLNKERQITVLISSHILDELARLATHFGFIDHGEIVREISAQDLEAACRKCSRIQVTNIEVLPWVLDRLGVEYQILNEREADIFGNINITQLVLALSEEHCEVLAVQEHDESLESYYMNLIGGVHFE